MISPLRQGNQKAILAIASLVTLVGLVTVVAFVPSVLTQIVVPENIQLSRLLGSKAPDALDFQFPEPSRMVKKQADLEAVSAVLLPKEATRTSLGRPAVLSSDSPRYQFDYGYKGPTVRVLDDGAVEVILAKSELRHRSFAGDLWTKLVDGDKDKGVYVSYITPADPEILTVIGHALGRLIVSDSPPGGLE
jgi:hypothetical protein